MAGQTLATAADDVASLTLTRIDDAVVQVAAVRALERLRFGVPLQVATAFRADIPGWENFRLAMWAGFPNQGVTLFFKSPIAWNFHFRAPIQVFEL